MIKSILADKILKRDRLATITTLNSYTSSKRKTNLSLQNFIQDLRNEKISKENSSFVKQFL